MEGIADPASQGISEDDGTKGHGKKRQNGLNKALGQFDEDQGTMESRSTESRVPARPTHDPVEHKSL
jgi:hypothetical protein